MFRLINEFLSPEDAGSGGSDTDDVIGQAGLEKLIGEALEETTEEEPEVLDLKTPKPDKTQQPEENEETEDSEDEEGEDKEEKSLEDELEEDLEEPDEEKLDALVTPAKRREILAKYPNLFKDFPYLEAAYYREQKYTEYFPTPKDAEVASEKAKTWDRFAGELEEGNLENVLNAVYEGDKNTFYKIADTILETIKTIDEPAAIHIYSGVAKNIIEMMVNAGNVQGQEQLKVAAQLAYQYLFGAREWEPHKPLHKASQKDPRADAISQKEKELLQRQFTTARDEIDSKITNSIRATIERNIDPRNSMTAYLKGKAVDDVLKDVQAQMETDKRFQRIVTQLWQNAVSKNFDEGSKQEIRRAVLAKAKQLLLPAINKGRKTALGQVARSRDKQEVTRPEKTGPSQKPGKSTSPMNSGKTPREVAKSIPKDVSTRDFLMSD